MEKRNLENKVLERSLNLLKKLYGEIEIDRNQFDRPDAAIDVIKPRRQLGKKSNPSRLESK